jgi:hypothetical protein
MLPNVRGKCGRSQASPPGPGTFDSLAPIDRSCLIHLGAPTHLMTQTIQKIVLLYIYNPVYIYICIRIHMYIYIIMHIYIHIMSYDVLRMFYRSLEASGFRSPQVLDQLDQS